MLRSKLLVNAGASFFVFIMRRCNISISLHSVNISSNRLHLQYSPTYFCGNFAPEKTPANERPGRLSAASPVSYLLFSLSAAVTCSYPMPLSVS